MSRHEIIQDRNCPPLSTLLSLLEQASKRNDEDGGGRRAPANPAIVFWRISPSDRSVAPLSTLLSLLEQASARNDEVAATTRLMGGGLARSRKVSNYFLEKDR